MFLFIGFHSHFYDTFKYFLNINDYFKLYEIIETTVSTIFLIALSIIVFSIKKTKNENVNNIENVIDTPIISKSILYTWPIYTFIRGLLIGVIIVLTFILHINLFPPSGLAGLVAGFAIRATISLSIIIPLGIALLSFLIALISLHTNIHIPFKIWVFISKYWKSILSIIIIGFTIFVSITLYNENKNIKQIKQDKIIWEMKKNDESEIIKIIIDTIPDISPTVEFFSHFAESKVRGYYTAQFTVRDRNNNNDIYHNLTVWLYKKDLGSWVYFRNSKSSNMCSEYNTTDLKNAFKGSGCYREDGKLGVVK
jgi:hypothetical protein